MRANIQNLRAELEPYKDTLVLDIFNVVRLVGVTEDEEDFWWIYDSKNGEYWSSCVGGWTPLKGHLKDEDYNNLVRIWNLNNKTKAK